MGTVTSFPCGTSWEPSLLQTEITALAAAGSGFRRKRTLMAMRVQKLSLRGKMAIMASCSRSVDLPELSSPRTTILGGITSRTTSWSSERMGSSWSKTADILFDMSADQSSSTTASKRTHSSEVRVLRPSLCKPCGPHPMTTSSAISDGNPPPRALLQQRSRSWVNCSMAAFTSSTGLRASPMGSRVTGDETGCCLALHSFMYFSMFERS
mmetsp:Transcript_75486/g.175012  ORF Transcript_75486/g.175012 Transcript_75486/m.175012 type:complete len:210 (+) Transcript_75486:999-1628(+)